MRAVDIIIKKRDKQELTKEEIDFFIRGFTNGEIPDYQASAWAMAVLLNGMTPRETTDLTLAMAHSGEVLDLTGVIRGTVVDKHSTGGVGDKTSLVVAPTVAACGLPVGKMSGHGLGFSGGTLDKLESIPGYRTNLSTSEFLEQLRAVGVVLTGQSVDLAPADGKLYALRDVTGTIQSIPLIVSSIMSKKIAAGAQAIVLDVKVGLGAFMESMEKARALAEQMVEIAGLTGRRAVALLADMNQPLGEAVGNALELKEAIATLQGDGPADFRAHCLEIAAQLLLLGGIGKDETHGRTLATQALASGEAWKRFRALVTAQGGDVGFIDNPERLPSARLVEVERSERAGWVCQAHARLIGETVVALGGGRAKKGDPIDYGVGVILHAKVGDRVEVDQPLYTLYANDENRLKEGFLMMHEAYQLSDEPVDPLPLFYEIIR